MDGSRKFGLDCEARDPDTPASPSPSQNQAQEPRSEPVQTTARHRSRDSEGGQAPQTPPRQPHPGTPVQPQTAPPRLPQYPTLQDYALSYAATSTPISPAPDHLPLSEVQIGLRAGIFASPSASPFTASGIRERIVDSEATPPRSGSGHYTLRQIQERQRAYNSLVGRGSPVSASGIRQRVVDTEATPPRSGSRVDRRGEQLSPLSPLSPPSPPSPNHLPSQGWFQVVERREAEQARLRQQRIDEAEEYRRRQKKREEEDPFAPRTDRGFRNPWQEYGLPSPPERPSQLPEPPAEKETAKQKTPVREKLKSKLAFFSPQKKAQQKSPAGSFVDYTPAHATKIRNWLNSADKFSNPSPPKTIRSAVSSEKSDLRSARSSNAAGPSSSYPGPSRAQQPQRPLYNTTPCREEPQIRGPQGSIPSYGSSSVQSPAPSARNQQPSAAAAHPPAEQSTRPEQTASVFASALQLRDESPASERRVLRIVNSPPSPSRSAQAEAENREPVSEPAAPSTETESEAPSNQDVQYGSDTFRY